ncbi:hypothetical protein COCSUDRAFT_40554 [Coccomyxa subellipsoidea C-169]|uniref:Uncharacterized protein n=1 Tax=Coccomyxa subellipsoidea (strain C-169) TaxID=574566 RepID=I0Z3M8_COCSC|nr:hypothetical protein COCSUDRAFT_40554 [Coccomyxa subellipsoidea C-169]EIE25247.1 hypothetical protein COCSUDRAFT_40554 [Coccomyxa subellipsoidea C-169]|eukprot:XP_005649791.1 hypothetical protein COCSUDRAFT_40554 [Coccomyxa subellipsoidea C-169]
MQGRLKALLALCLIFLLAISGASARRESWTGRSAQSGESAGVRRSIVGWSAQRNMLGYDYVYAAKKEEPPPKKVVEVKQQVVKIEKPKPKPKVVYVKKASPPPPEKKFFAIKKYG